VWICGIYAPADVLLVCIRSEMGFILFFFLGWGFNKTRGVYPFILLIVYQRRTRMMCRFPPRPADAQNLGSLLTETNAHPRSTHVPRAYKRTQRAHAVPLAQIVPRACTHVPRGLNRMRRGSAPACIAARTTVHINSVVSTPQDKNICIYCIKTHCNAQRTAYNKHCSKCST
jgi:hypothetical protein